MKRGKLESAHRPGRGSQSRLRRWRVTRGAAGPILQPRYLGVKLTREFLSVRSGRAELSESDRSFDASFAEESDQVWNEGHVLPITDLLTHVPGPQSVLNQAHRQGL